MTFPSSQPVIIDSSVRQNYRTNLSPSAAHRECVDQMWPWVTFTDAYVESCIRNYGVPSSVEVGTLMRSTPGPPGRSRAHSDHLPAPRKRPPCPAERRNLQARDAQGANDQHRRKRQLPQRGGWNRQSEVAALGGQHVEPGVAHEQNSRREREQRQQVVMGEAEHRSSKHERQQQDIEAAPGRLPMLGGVALRQGHPQIDSPRDQRDRGAERQPLADPADLDQTP